jgi:predicted O-methyltransferase YrrM
MFRKWGDENDIGWADIVKTYGYDACKETDYHEDGSHHNKAEQHELFHCSNDGGASEFEVTNFLNALVKLFKFRNILETGAEQGHGTVALAEAVKYNGVGHVTTVDNCKIAKDKVAYKLSECKLEEYVTYVESETTAFCKQYDGEPFDFCFFDCGHQARVECYKILRQRNKLSRIISFHDVSYHSRHGSDMIKWYCEQLDNIESEYGGLFNVLSRGFRMFQLAL